MKDLVVLLTGNERDADGLDDRVSLRVRVIDVVAVRSALYEAVVVRVTELV